MPRAPSLTRPSKPAPASVDDINQRLDRLGVIRGQLTELRTQLDDDIAQLRLQYADRIASLTAEEDALFGDVQAYCEARRAELTGNGRVKGHRFANGSVTWRKRPAGIEVADPEQVLAWLREHDMAPFIRVRETINKDALLDAPEIARSIPGVTYLPGTENFSIKTAS